MLLEKSVLRRYLLMKERYWREVHNEELYVL